MFGNLFGDVEGMLAKAQSAINEQIGVKAAPEPEPKASGKKKDEPKPAPSAKKGPEAPPPVNKAAAPATAKPSAKPAVGAAKVGTKAPVKAPVKAGVKVPPAAIKKQAIPAFLTPNIDGVYDKSDEAPKVDPNATPRKRPPGPPLCMSSADLFKEAAMTRLVRDEDAMMFRRENILHVEPISNGLEFTQLRKPSMKQHPRVLPRQVNGAGEDSLPGITSLMSEVSDDPFTVQEAHGIDKVIQSRQFILAMRMSLKVPDSPKKVSAKPPPPLQAPTGPIRPISPQQEHITTVSFLPTPFAVCETCGLYSHSCVCAIPPRRSRKIPVNPLDKRKHHLRARTPASDDEGEINPIFRNPAPRTGSDRFSDDGGDLN